MNLLTQHLDTWTTAPNGIKKLRELILELAVRGLLVPQNPDDEPASVLLEKIAAEKARLISEGKIKKSALLPKISDDEKPFDLPNGWEWVRLSNLAALENGDRSKNYPNKSVLVDDGVPFVNAGHLEDGFVNKAKMTFITQARFDILRSGKFIEGDILYCLRGSLGKAAIVKNFDKGAIASSLVIIRLYPSVNNVFFMNYLKCPLSSLMVKKYDNGTAQPNLAATDLIKFLIPLPPLAEQHRIVAKVDELMQLCDQLEQKQTSNQEIHAQLVSTLLTTLTQATDQQTFQAAWTRIASNFDSLFTTESSIEQLKQTILQLAVMGKLVEQEAGDEPASVLLEKIAQEKARLISEGKIKKSAPLPKIADDEKPFDLPDGWEYSRFGNVSINRDGERIPVSSDERQSREKIYDYYGASGVIDKIDNFLFDKTLLLIGEDGANLINRSTPIAFLAHGKYWVNNHAHVVDAYCQDLMNYLCLYINAISLEPYVTGTAQPKMNQAKLNSIVINLPPLSEQHRIVAKVDELMALCYQLKTKLNTAQTLQGQLAEAVG